MARDPPRCVPDGDIVAAGAFAVDDYFNGGAVFAVMGWLVPTSGQHPPYPARRRTLCHRVIVNSRGAAWVTNGGLDAVVRVDPASDDVAVYPCLPNIPTPTSIRPTSAARVCESAADQLVVIRRRRG